MAEKSDSVVCNGIDDGIGEDPIGVFLVGWAYLFDMNAFCQGHGVVNGSDYRCHNVYHFP
tara:strand:+ start:141 stop:320 length:180 start_codon:yes stop_codon:yes gene_type:complete